MSMFAPTIEFLTHRAKVCRMLAEYVRAVDTADPMFASAPEYEAAADDAIVAARVLRRESGVDVIGGGS